MKRIICIFISLISLNAFADGKMDTTTYQLQEVVETGRRFLTDTRHLPMTLSVIDRNKLTENYRENVLPTLTEQIPGLFVTGRGLLGYGVSTGAAGGIKVRGIGGTADLLVLIDGLPQYAGLYGHPIADAYQTQMAERIEILRGPASMIYGSNAMGGVVNIVTRKMEKDGTQTHVNLQAGSYGTLEANLSNRFRSGKFFSIISANYGRTDGHRKNSEFEQTAGFVKLGYDFNKQWTLSGNTDITYFESSNPGEVTNPYLDNDMMITRGMAAISLTNTYEKTSGALRMYYNWGHHHIDDGYHPGATSPTYYYIHDDRMGGFSLYQSVSLLPGNHITMGLDYQNFGGHAYDKAKKDGARTELAKKNINEIAGYVQVSQELLSWMTFDGGIRLDHHSLSGNEWIPQGGFSFHFDDNSTGRVMISKGFRNATIRELYMFRPANANLKPEKLMNYELSYQKHLLDNKLYLGANVYYLKADNMIQTTMVNGKPLNANTGETENSGFEIEFKYQANTHFTLNGNYSFLHMSHPQLAAPEHKCFVEGSWKPTKLLQINTGIQYIAGLYTATGTKKKKENYWLWNTTVNINIQKGLHLFVRGENLLAQKYETVSGFPMPRATIMSGIDWTF